MHPSHTVVGSGGYGLFAYKLDLSKAYDRVDWEFLEKALVKWGFDSVWISRKMACVSSVEYSVKFNGKLLDSFTPTRGDDPQV